MRPIQATIEAINEIERFRRDDGLLDRVSEMAERVREVVPDCVGMSLATIATGVTLTLVATDDEIAALDGLQYIGGGPCVAAAEGDHGIDAEVSGVLDEKGWQLYARGAAAEGVASSLTLPIVNGEQVVGTVNLYASGSDRFYGHEDELARVLGAWAGGAVSNADLGFHTRTLAERGPQLLQDQADIDAATGILSMLEDLTLAQARGKLRDAALRAGLDEVHLARTIIASQSGNR